MVEGRRGEEVKRTEMCVVYMYKLANESNLHVLYCEQVLINIFKIKQQVNKIKEKLDSVNLSLLVPGKV